MKRTLQHGAASCRPKRVQRNNNSDNEDLNSLREQIRLIESTNAKLLDLLQSKQDSNQLYRRLPQFKGQPDEDFMVWFDDFKLSTQHAFKTEAEKLALFKTYLSGDARHVYEGFKPNDIQTLNKAGEMMNQVFAIARDQQDWMIHLRELKKGPTENVRVFAYRTTRLVRQAFPNADENTCNSLAIDYFTRGLPDSINNYIMIRKPDTLELAIRHAIIAGRQETPNIKVGKDNNIKQSVCVLNTGTREDKEPYPNDINNRFKQVTEELKGLKARSQELSSLVKSIQQTQTQSGPKQPNDDEKYDQILSTMQQVNQLQYRHPYLNETVQSGDKRKVLYTKPEITCYKCGKTGHLARSCFSPKVCFNCGKSGHMRRDCYVSQTTSLKGNDITSRSRR